MKESTFVRLVPIAQADEERAWEIFSRYRDHDFSYADCASFAVMQRMKLGTAFRLDDIHPARLKAAIWPPFCIAFARIFD